MPTKYELEDAANHTMLYNKWVYKTPMPLNTPMQVHYQPSVPRPMDSSGRLKRIAIWTGPAHEPWDKEKVDQGMAGSETWVAYIAREFVKRGYRTTIYNHLPAPDKTARVLDQVVTADGIYCGDVVYRDHTQMAEDIRYDVVDYFIASRSLEPLRGNVHSITSWVMIHDVWVSADKGYDMMSWKVSKYACLSEWHRQFFSAHHNIPVDKIFMTANGVDQSLYAKADTYQKKNQMVYSSSPDRGLYELLVVLPEIRKAVPDFQVVVCYGFKNWESSCKARGDKNGEIAMEKIKKAMDQPGVVYVDRISKKKLAEYQMESKVWLFCTWFSETFCISAVENGLSRNAILSSDYAGLKTTVGDAGILLPGQSNSKEYLDRFTAESIKLLTDEEYRRSWADKAYEKMKVYTWAHAADTWIKQFNGGK